MINLIGNSLKFTNEGTVELRVIQLNNSLLKFQVVDTGIGIKSENIPKLTNRFESFNSNDQNREGIGLGLSIYIKF